MDNALPKAADGPSAAEIQAQHPGWDVLHSFHVQENHSTPLKSLRDSTSDSVVSIFNALPRRDKLHIT